MKKLVLVLGLATLFSCEKEAKPYTIFSGFDNGQFGGGGSGGNW